MFIAIIILSLLVVFASAKAFQYKTQIEKIQKSTWASSTKWRRSPPQRRLTTSCERSGTHSMTE